MAEVIDFYNLRAQAVRKEIEKERKEIQEAKNELKEAFEESVLTICEFLYEADWNSEQFEDAINDLKESIAHWEKAKKELKFL